MRSKRVGVFVCAWFLAGSSIARASGDLGTATDFNVFVFNDVVELNSDSEGRMAVGGNAMLTNFGVGDKLTNSAGSRDDLIVEGNLTYTNGQVFNGNVAYGGTASISGLGVPNGTIRQESGVIDFAAAQAELENISLTYSAIPANGTYTSNFGVTLTGTDPNLNVFDVTAAQLEAANFFGLTLDVPTGSTALINVGGASVNLLNFQFFNFDPGLTLFNYYQAGVVDIEMQNLAPHGSLLAPTADVTFKNGQLLGTLVASSLDGSGGSGEFHHYPFTGVVPEPSTLGLLALGVLALLRRNG
jgi:choice-of-anchor A domain-containing protein